MKDIDDCAEHEHDTADEIKEPPSQGGVANWEKGQWEMATCVSEAPRADEDVPEESKCTL